METILLILAVIFGITGLIGCLLPAIPGPPLSYLGLLLVQWAIQPFSLTFLIVTGVITAVVVAFEFLLPLYTAKKYGATRQGIMGSVIGMTLGIFLSPVGMVAGLVIGSIIGDLIAGQKLRQATHAAAGTVLGTLLTFGVKLIWSGVLCWYIISRIFLQSFLSFSIFG